MRHRLVRAEMYARDPVARGFLVDGSVRASRGEGLAVEVAGGKAEGVEGGLQGGWVVVNGGLGGDSERATKVRPLHWSN